MSDKVETIEYWADEQVITSGEVLALRLAEHPKEYDRAVEKWKSTASMLDRVREIQRIGLPKEYDWAIPSPEMLARLTAKLPGKYAEAVAKWKVTAGVLSRAREIRDRGAAERHHKVSHELSG